MIVCRTSAQLVTAWSSLNAKMNEKWKKKKIPSSFLFYFHFIPINKIIYSLSFSNTVPNLYAFFYEHKIWYFDKCLPMFLYYFYFVVL